MRRKFAENAQQLPSDIKDYKTGVAYAKVLSEDDVISGLKSTDFVETSMLNTFLKQVLSFLDELSWFGICKKTSDFCEGVEYDDNSLTMTDDKKVMIGSKYLDAMATENENGFIKTSDCLNTLTPLLGIPESSKKNAGKVIIDDYVLKEDYNKIKHTSNIILGNIDRNNTISDNDFSIERYYGNGNSCLTINVKESSHIPLNPEDFWAKRFFINNKNMQLSAFGNIFKGEELSNDCFVLATGEICG